MATLDFPSPFDAARRNHLFHPLHDTETPVALEFLIRSISAPQTTDSELFESLLILADLVTTWAIAQDCVRLGSIPMLTHLLRSNDHRQLLPSLRLISQICTLAPVWLTVRSVAEAETLQEIAILIGSDSAQIRAAAIEASKRLVTSVGPILSKNFVTLVPICKALVDIIQLDSWETEGEASAVLWAIADLEFDEADVTRTLDIWEEGFYPGLGVDASIGAANAVADNVPLVGTLEWSLEDVDVANLVDVHGYRVENRLVINISALYRLHEDVKPPFLREARRRVQDAVWQQTKSGLPSRPHRAGSIATSPASDGLGDSVIDKIIAGGFRLDHDWYRGVGCTKLQVELHNTFPPRPPRQQEVEVTSSADITLHSAQPETRSVVNVSVNLLMQIALAHQFCRT